ATFTVDGQPIAAGADGALHLAPRRHRVLVSSPQLGAPRRFAVNPRPGGAAGRAPRSGRRRPRGAGGPRAEGLPGRRPVGTTPLQPISVREGAHVVTLRNGDLKASVQRRVNIASNRESLLRVDLFGQL